MKTARKLFVIVVFALVAAVAFSQIKADSTGWEKDDFTTDWVEYEWSFLTDDLRSGENSINFTYTGGGQKLCLKEQ